MLPKAKSERRVLYRHRGRRANSFLLSSSLGPSPPIPSAETATLDKTCDDNENVDGYKVQSMHISKELALFSRKAVIWTINWKILFQEMKRSVTFRRCKIAFM
jgi:hypothetical protein